MQLSLAETLDLIWRCQICSGRRGRLEFVHSRPIVISMVCLMVGIFFLTPCHTKKNLTILKYQIKSVYKFFLQLSANSRDESNEFN